MSDMRSAVRNPETGEIFFNKVFVQDAVDIVIGDDGRRAKEVLRVLDVLLEEAYDQQEDEA